MYVWRNVAGTYRTIYSYVNSDLRPFGLTPPQYTVMRIIGVSKSRKMAMSEIGNNMVVTFANVTTIVDNLEKRGYVKRVRDSVDRRRIMVELTPSGQSIFEKIYDSHGRTVEKLMSTLTNQELRNLNEYMDRLKKRAI